MLSAMNCDPHPLPRTVLGGMLVGNYSEYFQLPIFEHFFGRDYHTIQAVGRWAPSRLLKRLQPYLIRSDRFRPSHPAQKENEKYTRLLFHPADDLFVLLENGRLSAIASTETAAEESLARLARTCRAPKPKKPSFALLSIANGIGVRDVQLPQPGLLDAADLRLNYGDDFPDWESRFVSQLRTRPSGLSILRGDPGTGKTTFIRHVMWKLRATHRFYYLPADYSQALTSPDMTRFWIAQQAEAPELRRVIVLEDAEALLQVRQNDNRSRVANLLNAADGLMSDFHKLHILSTLNCPLDSLDPALLRPGRLLACRHFRRLTCQEGLRLARARSLTPPPQEDYSLAEIYHPSITVEEPAKAKRLGFAA